MKNSKWLKRLGILSLVCMLCGGAMLVAGYMKSGTLEPLFSFHYHKETTMEYFYDDLSTLDIDANAIALRVSKGDENKIIVKNIDMDEIEIQERNGVVNASIDQNRRFKDQEVIITIKQPELEKFNLQIDAGKVDISNLHVQKLKIENDAATIDMNNVEVDQKTELYADAGSFDLQHMIAHNATIDIDAGAIDFSGLLTGKSKIQADAGSIEVSITGDKKEYGYRLKNQAGSLVVDHEKIKGFSTTLEHQVDAENVLDITCAAGRIEVNFE